MACCLLTAFIMNRIIKICDTFDMRFLEIRYSDAEDSCAPAQLTQKMISNTCYISIEGMTCGACVASITAELDNTNGVHRVEVSLALGRASISYDPGLTTSERLAEAIGIAGYEAEPGERSLDKTIERLRQSSELKSLRVAISSASICSTLILGLEYIPVILQKASLISAQPRMISWLLSIIAFRVQAWDARTIHLRAWSGKKRLALTMDTLLSLSLILSLGLSALQAAFSTSTLSTQANVSSGSFLTIVILAGRYLEAVLKREGNAHLTALYEMQMEKEAYQVSGSELTMPASLLRKGDSVLLLPQATVPCDCYIIKGDSAIDESTITGESLPLRKGTGDFLLAGTKNLSRHLEVIICQDRSESSLAKVIEGVSVATEQRLEGMGSLDMIMRVFVTGVILLALVAFAANLHCYSTSPFLDVFTVACERAMTVLAAACPCGIGLATPSAAMAGVDAAYSKGVLLSGGIKTMDAMSKATHVVLDKTGTLTEGNLSVISHSFHKSLTLKTNMCYRLLAAAEADDARIHPVAKAIFKWALIQSQANKIKQAPEHIAKARNAISTTGKGTSCEVRAFAEVYIRVIVGTAEYLVEAGVDMSEVEISTTEASKVYFAFNGHYGGHLCVQDTIRPEASSIIKSLVSNGLEVTMLTGDAEPEASRISSLLGIPVLASRASPSDKQRFVQDLQRQGHHVVMVGDGINDCLAQAAADVGVSISLGQGCLAGAGSVVILSGNLQCLVAAFSIASHVVAQAKVNIRWALVYNVVALSMALGLFERWGVTITPSMAGSMMALSSVSVLSMSLWLRHRLRK